MQALLRKASQEGVGAGMSDLPFAVAGLPGTADPPVIERVLDPVPDVMVGGLRPGRRS